MLLQRGEHGNREILDRVVVTPADGIPGDAWNRFVSEPAWRHRNLRGIYLRVVAGGEFRTGARAQVLKRGPRDCLG
jgi:hypothetical protein